MNDPETQFVSDTSFSCIWFYNYSDTLPSVFYFAWVIFFYLCCSLACTRMYVLTSVATTLCNLIHGLMKRLDQGHLNPLLEHPKTNMSRPGIEPWPPGEHSSKELFEQLMLLLFGTSTASIFFQSSYMTSSPHQNEVVLDRTSTWTHLYNVLCSNILELDGLHILEGEAELLPVGEAGLELDEVNGNHTRVPADHHELET